MEAELLDPRSVPRVFARLLVDVRHRFTSFRAETEDIGPGGCQIVAPRVVEVGRDVRLVFHARGSIQVVRVPGRVVWARPEAPFRLGIAFTAPALDAKVIEELAADPLAGRAMNRLPPRLPGAARLHLAEPPAAIEDLSADEVLVVRHVRAGTTVASLARELGGSFERVRGVVFGLLSRRLLTLDPGRAVPRERWNGPLARAEADLSLAGLVTPPPLVIRPQPAQRLYEEGVAHLQAGRMGMALARFREALALAPEDEVISGAARRLSPWVR